MWGRALISIHHFRNALVSASLDIDNFTEAFRLGLDFCVQSQRLLPRVDFAAFIHLSRLLPITDTT